MNHKGSLITGIIFIAVGAIFLLNNFDLIDYNVFNVGHFFATYWAGVFIILPAFLMHLQYFSGNNKDAGILVPAGILMTVGIVCQISMLFGIWGVMWPGFIAAPAIGLFELYLFGKQEKGLLIPVTILGALSAIFFVTISLQEMLSSQTRGVIIPVLLIGAGAWVLLRRKDGKREFK